jgi:hypothetical protein
VGASPDAFVLEIAKDGNCDWPFSDKELITINDHLMSYDWPPFSSSGSTAVGGRGRGDGQKGGHMGNYCDELLKTIGCFDVTDDLGDVMWDVQTDFGQRLLTSSFKWNSLFVGVNVSDEVSGKLPAEGQALLTIFDEFSEITFCSEESSRSIDLPGHCLLMMPRHAKSKGKT